MTAEVKINPTRYAGLLAETMPGRITTEQENDRCLAIIAEMMDREKRSPEEDKLMDLLITLIEEFEDRHYQLNASTPLSILQTLMENRGVAPKDLWEIFGSKGIASEVLNGKRSISKAQAKKLAEYFNVSAELFI
ncbi:MAG: transcriptional regulator [Blastocatellia bacterium]|nr:transcriptional regulator [Blastocatellia bacterium]